AVEGITGRHARVGRDADARTGELGDEAVAHQRAGAHANARLQQTGRAALAANPEAGDEAVVAAGAGGDVLRIAQRVVAVHHDAGNVGGKVQLRGVAPGHAVALAAQPDRFLQLDGRVEVAAAAGEVDDPGAAVDGGDGVVGEGRHGGGERRAAVVG